MKYRVKKEIKRNMPKNKFQGFVFGIIMSYAMAYGMEVYNIAIKAGSKLNYRRSKQYDKRRFF